MTVSLLMRVAPEQVEQMAMPDYPSSVCEKAASTGVSQAGV